MIVDIGNKKDTAMVDLKKDTKWTHSGANGVFCYVAGYAFLNDDFMNSKSLTEFFLKQAKPDFSLFIDLVKRLNGSFAVILKYGDKIFASVDRIRSHPIFYVIKKDSFLISDNAHRIKEKLEADTINPHAVEEFLMSGYISQDETLYYDIKQLQPGEALHFCSGSTEKIVTERYYTYYNKSKQHPSIDIGISTYDDILFRTFQRLVKSVGGRKIVVPLSGGVDSRLVVSMLKKLGYKNVVCLSYGVPNNWETNISRRVAERLGCDWIYVPYSRKKWRDVYRSQAWRDFFYSQDNLSSLPNGDEWIAVRELKRNKSIPDDAIFVPGHTGDFISGGHLQYLFSGKEGRTTKQDLLYSILNKHYSLWPSRLDKPEIKDYLLNRLVKFFEGLPTESEQDIANAYEYWEWQERQAKFIVNSVRTYDFWGYEWRLPLWDSEIMDFWSVVPFELKLGKKLYLTYLKEKDEFQLFGKDLQRKRLHEKRLISGKLRKFTEYFKDIKGLYGIHNYFTVSFLNAGRRNVNSILVKDYIKRLLGRDYGKESRR